MNHDEKAKVLHGQAEWARESQDYAQALSLYAQALFYFAESKNLPKVSEVHAGLSLVYRHLLKQASDASLQQLWKKEVSSQLQLSLEVAQLAAANGDNTGLAFAYFNRAKFFESEGDYARAITHFQNAIKWLETAPPVDQNRPAVLWDFKLKLALAKMVSGEEKSAMSEIEEAITALIADTGVDAQYNIKVWVSGAYLRLAEHFKTIDLNQAQQFLAQAKTIIDSDDRLGVRKADYERVAAKIAA